jgi:hypothetical protein
LINPSISTIKVGSAALAVSGSSWFRMESEILSVNPLAADDISDAQPVREIAVTRVTIR